MNLSRSGTTNMVLALLLVSLLAGCKDQVLYSGLNEQEANEMVALLYASGLPATKVSTKGGVFQIDTTTEAFASSMAILQANGLPKKRFASLGDVFAKEGFVSSPLEERARLNYALSEELSHTLSTIDGVILARVHLAFPEKEHLVDIQMPASASVFVKHRYDVDLTSNVSKIKALVVDGVENLPYENVTVGLFAANAPTRVDFVENPVLQAGVEIDKSVLAVAAAALLSFGLITLLIGRFTQRRKATAKVSLK